MNDTTRQLQQLLKIGTARAGGAPLPSTADLTALLPASDAQESRLWLSLGAIDLWERSGFVPASAMPGQAQRAPAPSDTTPRAPARAAALLARLEHVPHAAALLAEWLRLLQRHGGHLPVHILPKLLGTATGKPALRAQLLPVLGARGRWLAQVQPEWAWAADTAQDGTALWETGTLDQRVAVLQAWRRRDPAGARTALAATWTSEPPEHRAALLAALDSGLGADDEAFLEAALDDRRKEVRGAAQRLLAILPGSALSQRMLARLLPLVTFDPAVPDGPRLELSLPSECDAAMRRDGVGAASHFRLGEKAGWVVDMLAAVDPDAWTAHATATPRACLALAEPSEFAAVFVRGWTLAAMHRAEHRWRSGLPLAPRDWLHDLALWWTGATPQLREALPDAFFELLATAGLYDMLDAMVAAFPVNWVADAGLVHMLERVAARSGDAWPAALSGRVLQRLLAAQPALEQANLPWSFGQLVPSLALVLDPATATGIESAWRAAEPPESRWRSLFDHFFSLVRLRHEMTLSFQEPA
jgi:hypothetical protein